MDLATASYGDSKVAWYENLGAGSFGPLQPISVGVLRAYDVTAADLDRDGDLDVLSVSWDDGFVVFHRNDGTGTFGSQEVITFGADGAYAVHAADLDGDGDPEVLSAANGDDRIAWYENWSGRNCCVATANSTGLAAVIGMGGSRLVADDDLTLAAWSLPVGQPAYFLMSSATDFVPGFGGSSGNLCLAQPVLRFNRPASGGQVLTTDGAGKADFHADFQNLPHGTVFQPGSTWNFQLWFRDGTTSNTTNGLKVTFL